VGQILVLGIVNGGIYALIAAGIVLVYKGSRVLNFAQAEIGTLSLYAAWWLSGEHGLPYFVGALATLVIAVLIGLAFERFAVRRMAEAPRVTVAVATIGLLTLAIAVENVWFGPSPRRIPPPVNGLGIHVAGVYVSPAQLISLGVIALIAAGLTAFLRRTDFGLGVLAAAQDPTAAQMMGVPLRRVGAFVWGAAAALSAIAALLIEPSIGFLSPGALSGLFIGGLAAALVGGLTSLPGAFAGGFVVGIVEALIKGKLVSLSVPGITTLGLFAVIAAVLLFRPQGLLGSRA
jgi:branched-chain amino acid transport system permease protein